MNKKEYLKKFELKGFKGKWKTHGWVAIPNRVLFDEDLKSNDKLVFWNLSARIFRGRDYCFPSHKTIAKEIGLSRRSVIKSIKRLEEKEYIKIERGDGRSHKYYLNIKV